MASTILATAVHLVDRGSMGVRTSYYPQLLVSVTNGECLAPFEFRYGVHDCVVVGTL
jgi:hypothetical protein